MIIINNETVSYDGDVFTDIVYILASVAKQSDFSAAEFMSIFKNFLDDILKDSSFEKAIEAINELSNATPEYMR